MIMKTMLMSIKPKYVAKILNHEKTIEIRKKFPADFVGWVYIYCTKGKDNLFYYQEYDESSMNWYPGRYILVDYKDEWSLNGKVVARFWCDKVEEYVNGYKWSWKSGSTMWGACNDYEYILKDTCLTEDELYDYCEDLSFKAIHITKLEIFDKPKELGEFIQTKRKSWEEPNVKRPPQSWCWVEVEK